MENLLAVTGICKRKVLRVSKPPTSPVTGIYGHGRRLRPRASRPESAALLCYVPLANRTAVMGSDLGYRRGSAV